MSKLLTSGLIAGPFFFSVWLVQAFTRDGFDLRRHPMSLLANGDWGFIQIANFVITGALCILAAIGLSFVLRGGRAQTWGPVLIGAFGVGFVLAGVFVTDPGAGFPIGAPEGMPIERTLSGALHDVGFALAQVAWLAACFVLRRRFVANGERGWGQVCVAAAAGAVVVAGFPHLESMSLRLAGATAIELGFVAAVCRRFLHGAEPSTARLDAFKGSPSSRACS